MPYGVVGEPTVTELADLLLDAIFEQYPMLATLTGSRDPDDRLSNYSEAA